jgi:16S rRNA (cytosine1402-N4)-methyltransferase
MYKSKQKYKNKKYTTGYPMSDKIHTPVLLEPTLELLDPRPGQNYLDLTAGYGGHASEILKRIGKSGSATLVDRDIAAVNYLKERFKDDPRVKILHSDYLSASEALAKQGALYDCILADIGVSSPHLDNPDRGFSFMYEGPLDMRMDIQAPLTASEVVNTAEEDELADILHQYGEVIGSRKIARIIIQHRPYQTTSELAAVIPGTHKIRMRTLAQVFQALRIVVNDELGQLERSLPLWTRLLKPNGRLAVITFHSLEDRIVKQYFHDHGGNRFDSIYTILTKRPVVGTKSELVFNPRARSAKLRASQRK